mmetsp:Transcript_1677/g.4177  ORF Transcript_1677/g.4177 Transcript_1677/m.4177 type:complete len:306 (-) Transcript_1677:5-922(-)
MAPHQLQHAKPVTVLGPELGTVLLHCPHRFLGSLELDERHAGGPPVNMHDEADAVRLDLVGPKEFAYVGGLSLEGDALDLEDAFTTKPQRQRGLHLLARDLYKAHISVPKLVREHLVVLFLDGPGCLVGRLKIHKGLACGLVVRPYHQLYAIGLQSEAFKELNDVQLVGIKGQALDFHDTVRQPWPMSISLRPHVLLEDSLLHLGLVCSQCWVHTDIPVTKLVPKRLTVLLGCSSCLVQAIKHNKCHACGPAIRVEHKADAVLLDSAAKAPRVVEKPPNIQRAGSEGQALYFHNMFKRGFAVRHI